MLIHDCELMEVPDKWTDGDQIRLKVDVYEVIDNFKVTVGDHLCFKELEDKTKIKFKAGEIFTFSTKYNCFLSDHKFAPEYISGHGLKLWQWERV